MDDLINKIAKLLTDDPDIFNEMAVSTGGIAIGMGGNMPRARTRKKKVQGESGDEVEGVPPKHKKYHANPVTGKPEKGEVLFADVEETENQVE